MRKIHKQTCLQSLEAYRSAQKLDLEFRISSESNALVIKTRVETIFIRFSRKIKSIFSNNAVSTSHYHNQAKTLIASKFQKEAQLLGKYLSDEDKKNLKELINWRINNVRQNPSINGKESTDSAFKIFQNLCETMKEIESTHNDQDAQLSRLTWQVIEMNENKAVSGQDIINSAKDVALKAKYLIKKFDFTEAVAATLARNASIISKSYDLTLNEGLDIAKIAGNIKKSNQSIDESTLFEMAFNNFRLKKLNAALPSNITIAENNNQAIKFSLTLSQKEQIELFKSLENEKKYEPKKSTTSMSIALEEAIESEINLKSGLNAAFCTDAGRSNFIFEEQGKDGNFQIICETGSESELVINELKNIAGKSNKQRQQTLSHLINQGAIGIQMSSLILNNPTQNDGLFKYVKSTTFEDQIFDDVEKNLSRNAELINTTYKVTKLLNGDYEVSYRNMEKIHQVLENNDDPISVNQSKKWKGDLNEKNYGVLHTARILLRAKDLDKGKIQPTFVDPVQMTFQIELAPASYATE